MFRNIFFGPLQYIFSNPLWAPAGEKIYTNLFGQYEEIKKNQIHLFLPAGFGGVRLFGCCLLSSWLCHIPYIQVCHYFKNYCAGGWVEQH